MNDLRDRLTAIAAKLDHDDAKYVIRALKLLNPCEDCGLGRINHAEACGCPAASLLDMYDEEIRRGLKDGAE